MPVKMLLDMDLATVVPALPANIVGMWDASNVASLNLTANKVNSIADVSGGGNTMVKAGSSNFPLWASNAFNTTYPGIVFTGTDLTGLQATPFPMGTGSTLTIWYVGTCARALTANQGRFISYTKPAAAQDFNNVGSFTLSTSGGSLTAFFMTNNTLNTSITGLAASPAGHRVIVTKDSSGVVTIYVDNVASTTFTSAGNWVDAGFMNIGEQHSSIASGLDYVSSAVGEVGVSTDFSSATAVAALDAYLKNKWGL